ncbi:MAG TPA: PAAR domain-containing protein [Chitinophagaceae bacterium]|jgi:uncharacterized Zn-binding protein involved in type VI secretion|nr:PAAR domain-containing protein [Chitinophagaceae bacterium]
MPGRPAARNSDTHLCPKPLSSPPNTPHGPGVIMAPGAARVFINSMPAAVAGDTCMCVEPGNTIQSGSSTVLIGGKGAARQMDPTTHAPGGMIQQGSQNVFIGG